MFYFLILNGRSYNQGSGVAGKREAYIWLDIWARTLDDALNKERRFRKTRAPKNLKSLDWRLQVYFHIKCQGLLLFTIIQPCSVYFVDYCHWNQLQKIWNVVLVFAISPMHPIFQINSMRLINLKQYNFLSGQCFTALQYTPLKTSVPQRSVICWLPHAMFRLLINQEGRS